MKRPEFSATEFKMLTELPGALEALADYHSYQEVCADASDMPKAAHYHEKRREYLLDCAAFIRGKWEDGEYAKFEGEDHVG